MIRHHPIESSRWIPHAPPEALIRVASPTGAVPVEPPAGAGEYWEISVGTRSADCWLVGGDRSAIAALPDMIASPLPIIVAFDGSSDTDSRLPAPLIDAADGFVFAGDDAARVAAVLVRACALDGGYQVRDVADGAARGIDALSDAGRIAAALAALAEAQRARPIADQPVDPALIRRLLRLRRDRERWFPAELFADPAWDMLLDLLAAQLEGRRVPVSSLCIAAAVPTTTALRWVRGLTEAGLFERRMDPEDARRAHVSLSADAAAGVLGWLRAFSDAFAPR